LDKEALSIENAVYQTITEGSRTVDLGGKLSSRQMTDEIIKHL